MKKTVLLLTIISIQAHAVLMTPKEELTAIIQCETDINRITGQNDSPMQVMLPGIAFHKRVDPATDSFPDKDQPTGRSGSTEVGGPHGLTYMIDPAGKLKRTFMIDGVNVTSTLTGDCEYNGALADFYKNYALNGGKSDRNFPEAKLPDSCKENITIKSFYLEHKGPSVSKKSRNHLGR